MTKGTVDGICSDDHRHLPKPGGVRDSKVSTNGKSGTSQKDGKVPRNLVDFLGSCSHKKPPDLGIESEANACL